MAHFTGLPTDLDITENPINVAKFSDNYEIQILDAVVGKKLHPPQFQQDRCAETQSCPRERFSSESARTKTNERIAK